MSPNDIEQLASVQQVQGVKEAFHLAYYHAERTGYQERISKYLRDFMKGSEPQTSRWISLAVPLIKKGSSFDVIIRALLFDEVSPVRFTPLDRLCQALSEVTGAPYGPERLEKTRVTSDLQLLGGKAARQKELEGVFRFDATGLPQKARVLIVDAIMTTGATTEAIAKSVKQALPQAEVICFVLGKADGRSANSHLNPDYFVGASPDAGARIPAPAGSATKNGSSSDRRGAGAATDQPAARDTADRPATREATDLPAARVTADRPAVQGVVHSAAASPAADSAAACITPDHSATDHEDPNELTTEEDSMGNTAQGPVGRPPKQRMSRPAAPKPAHKGTGKHGSKSVRIYVIGLVIIFLILGALGPLRSARNSVTNTAPLPDALPVAAELEPGAEAEEPAAPPEPAREVVDNFPKGRVTVPGVGLRVNHSLESRAVPRSKMRNGERVSILGRYAPSVGPRWLKIQTRSGKVGWVFASVVKESRSR